MKSSRPLLHRIVALSLAIAAPLLAQSTTGTIEGRVLNAATATYVEGARVTIDGTALETFTDADGRFLLAAVPAGSAQLRVVYTGAAPSVATLRVTADTTTTQEISLATLGRAPASAGETIKLAQFVVDESREMAGAAIAINEQRFAANIRNVVSTDEFGAVSDGNVTEFLKYLPGVTVNMSGGDGRYISIEGAPAANTPITLGGIGLSSPGDNNKIGRAHV